MLRVKPFTILENPMRTSSNLGDHLTQFLGNDPLPDMLMGDPILIQIIVVEKVAKRSVTYIMKECGDPQKLLYISGGWNVRGYLLK
jgi:hypothetical protein